MNWIFIDSVIVGGREVIDIDAVQLAKEMNSYTYLFLFYLFIGIVCTLDLRDIRRRRNNFELH